MQAIQNKHTLNDAQISLLQIFNKYQVSDIEVGEIRKMLANYFLEKTLNSTDEIWNANTVNEDTINNYIKGE